MHFLMLFFSAEMQDQRIAVLQPTDDFNMCLECQPLFLYF